MKSKHDPVRLDAWDVRILLELQSDGRISKSKLAKRVHLSPSACSDRLRLLQAAGIIEGFYARLSPALVGGVIFVMVEVVLDRHRLEDQRHFEAAVQDIPEILDCWAIGGRIDYLMRVSSPSMVAYQDFMERLLQSGFGIDQYYSLVVTKPVKTNSPIPLSAIRQR
ncbi:MAG: winged helix-turn-helix transcriptional regulator [Mesorhizobium sp.]|uniref:Lrp/AsnC family transcriptional regulator n=1 Tax=unclassified Mesorhizobium TaxID=325217 RepID=UPI000FCB760A|nr:MULTISPECIES: Lrp/AsnC family transcriptional regulator [unclassified Mesorhizobium]RVC47511.1 Lrp/AsnC family transcriptional regulator [Mesorhizobium sp. M4A.F.Ca.ET.090.04.2.1]RWD53721.1 MAG: Lrp/AsnC family transcriptional regulator [Mesorhizobium sp.]RWJ22605.1 MAG: Lrp/AsnC family transcriptional regulator [Mesorhizobium sp.]RWN15090.1 MAG: Lrp/AsnC family transcriptional regulator [Mesorhizobium sp.]RWN20996.1 MAG: Lrp/AsnC family transcriptional regulator [Mesorhizobium sp.]